MAISQRRPYDFASDNAAGIHPEILTALAECNTGTASPYGADPVSREIDALYADLFEHEAFVFAVPTGTAANGLALGGVTPSYGAIFCHEKAHIMTTECGAPEFFSGGARLVPLPGKHGKLTPETLACALVPYQSGSLHQLRAAALSLTQATESGTVYTLAELGALAETARSAGLKVHMDGARFANAIVRLGCSTAEMTWKAGVDIVSFGTTKNGTMNAEAVIAFDQETAEIVRYLHKRAGFLQSKMRFASAQLSAYVRDSLWIENAQCANKNAQRLAAALMACGARMHSDVEANEIFVHLPQPLVDRLAMADIVLRPWSHANGDMFRIVTSYRDADELISRFEAALARPCQTPNSRRLD